MFAGAALTARQNRSRAQTQQRCGIRNLSVFFRQAGIPDDAAFGNAKYVPLVLCCGASGRSNVVHRFAASDEL
jgi:hypothetical protein